MSGDSPSARGTARDVRRPLGDLVIVVIALGVVFAASSVLLGAERRGAIQPLVAEPLSYAVAWAPLVAAIVIGFARTGPLSVRDRLAVRAKPVDIAWGIGGGLFARAFALLATVVVTGRTGLGSPPSLDGGPHGWQAVMAVLFPVVIGPAIEELFFRGYLQRAVESLGRLRLSAWAATVIAVGVSAVLFAAMHVVLQADMDETAMLTLAIGALVFGVVAGAIVAYTGRVTGAIAAHIVFNAIAVTLTWPH